MFPLPFASTNPHFHAVLSGRSDCSCLYQFTIGSSASPFFPLALSLEVTPFLLSRTSTLRSSCDRCIVALGNRKALSVFVKNHLFASMHAASRQQDAEHPLVDLIHQTTQDPTRRARCVEAIRPILQYQHQLRLQNSPPSHQSSFSSFIAPAEVEMPRSNQPHGSDQRRTSSTHSSRTNTGQGMAPTHTISTNAGQASTGFASVPTAGQIRPPSYAASDPNASQSVSPTFPFHPNFDQIMPPTRPELGHMIVSVNRQKIVSDNMDWTTQFPLEDLRSSKSGAFSIDRLSHSRLLGELSEKIRSNVESEGNSVVWVMSTIDQLGIVRDNGSLKAAVLDHQIAGKHIVQLYVVREKGKSAISYNVLNTLRGLTQHSRGYRSARVSCHLFEDFHSSKGSNYRRWPSQSRSHSAARRNAQTAIHLQLRQSLRSLSTTNLSRSKCCQVLMGRTE